MEPQIKLGQFAWCRFPFREQQDEPGPDEHIAYVYAVLDEPDSSETVVAVFTTSQPQPPKAGNIDIAADQAKAIGQEKAFTIIPSRVAFIPLDQTFFPRLDTPDLTRGRANKNLQTKITEGIEQALKRNQLERADLGDLSNAEHKALAVEPPRIADKEFDRCAYGLLIVWPLVEAEFDASVPTRDRRLEAGPGA